MPSFGDVCIKLALERNGVYTDATYCLIECMCVYIYI